MDREEGGGKESVWVVAKMLEKAKEANALPDSVQGLGKERVDEAQRAPCLLVADQSAGSWLSGRGRGNSAAVATKCLGEGTGGETGLELPSRSPLTHHHSAAAML